LDALRAAGYDALRYSNLIEDVGSESVIVLESDQVAAVEAEAARHAPR
jgi:hypothetical protein